MVGVFVALAWGATDIGLGIGLGAALNLWNGVRASDQARQDYRSFVAASLSFAALRVGAGLGALYTTGDPALTAIAIYVFPVAGAAFSRSARYVVEAFAGPRRPVGDMLWYGATSISARCVHRHPVRAAIRHRVANERDRGRDLWTDPDLHRPDFSPGLFAQERAAAENAWGWFPVGKHDVESAGPIRDRRTVGRADGRWSAAGYGLEIFYAHKFPEIRSTFTMFFIGFSATAMIGLYSLSVHTLAVPQISAAIGIAKFAVLLVLLPLTGPALVDMVALTATVMVAGEIALVALLGARRHGLAV